ncbi:MAG TPA: AsmA-like C-terminal region-containing protein, partial [Cytophagales bacterium]|nr:AsmA-like C-terminal region-containing protein [Cytophagales bacterium]
ISGTISSTMHVHPDLTPIMNDSKAHLDIEIINGSLVKFAPIHAMAEYFQDKNLDLIRFDTLRNKLDFDKGVLSIPAMNINSSLGFIELSGKQSMDMNMEYYLSIPLSLVTQVGFKTLFAGKSQDEVSPDNVDAIVYRNNDKRIRFLNVIISGTPDNYKFSLGRNKS